MSTYRRPQRALPDTQPKLTPRNQLLAENILKTTRLYVRHRVQLSLQKSNKKSISYWHSQSRSCSKDSSSFACANSACDRLFAVQELADAIFAYFDDSHDIACCLAVNRSIRHAVQQSFASWRLNLPFRKCEDPHLLYMEKQHDLTISARQWLRHSQQFSMNTGRIMFPKNAPVPLLVSSYDIVNTIGELRRSRITVDIWFSATKHPPKDFALDGSWLNMSLPLPETAIWHICITCDCHRTISFLNRLDFSKEVDCSTYKDGTPLVFPYKLVTENGNHLRQIAEYAREAYRLHRHCRNDFGGPSSGLSSITFHTWPQRQRGYELINLSAFTTRPSPKFRTKVSTSTSLTNTSQEKSRRETLHDIQVELTAPSLDSRSWDEVAVEISPGAELLGNVLRRTEHIPSGDFVFALQALEQLSAWDKLMGRTEVKLGY